MVDNLATTLHLIFHLHSSKPTSRNSNPLPKLPQTGDAELLLP